MKRLLAIVLLAFSPLVLAQKVDLQKNVQSYLLPANGGTGVVNNNAATLTFAGTAAATTFTLSGVTGVTLPTSGTLAALGGTNTWSAGNTFTVASPQITLGTSAATNPGGIKLFGSTSGYATVAPAAVSGTAAITLPNANSTLPIFGQQVTFTGPTAARSYALPDAAATLARTDAGQTFTGVQAMTSPAFTTSFTTGATFTMAAAATALDIGAATGTFTVNNATLAAKAGTFSTTLGVTGHVATGTASTTAWSLANYNALAIGNTGNALFSGANDFYLVSNAYYAGAWKHSNTSAPTSYHMASGSHVFGFAAAGSADATFSFTNALTISNTGAVSIPGTLAVTGAITFSSTSSPASGAACTAGTWTWDASYIYVCTASAAWKRAALTGGY